MKRFGSHSFSVLWTLFTIIPLFTLVVCSLTGSFNISNIGGLKVSFDRFVTVIQESGYSYVNSLIAAIAAIAINLVVCPLAGYAFSRYNFRGKSWFSYLIWITYALPLISGFIGIFIMFKTLDMLNNLFSLAVEYAATCIAVNTWLAIGYFDSIPRALEEAAFLDGCSRLRVLFSIMIPLSTPVLVSMATYTFFMSWNEFILASILISSKSSFTFPVALMYQSTAGISHGGGLVYGIVAAGSVIGILPVVIMSLFFRKYLVVGLTRGAVKGA